MDGPDEGNCGRIGRNQIGRRSYFFPGAVRGRGGFIFEALRQSRLHDASRAGRWFVQTRANGISPLSLFIWPNYDEIPEPRHRTFSVAPTPGSIGDKVSNEVSEGRWRFNF